MSAQLQVFNFENQNVRTVIIDGETYWVANDVCNVLGYKKPMRAIELHCKGTPKWGPLETPGGVQQIRIISESDLLRLIIGSRLPAAEKFERWVFEEVLPTIRKTGGYGITSAIDPLDRLQSENNRLAIENEELYFENKKLKKREELHQKLGGAIYLHDVAIQLYHLGIGDGNENALVKKLVANGILQKDQSAKRRYLIRPYLRHVRHGYFVHRLDASDQPVPIIQSKILVTPKGFDWIVGEFEKIDNKDYGQNHPLLGYIRECMRIPAEAGGPIEVTDERGVNHKYV